MPCWMSRDSLPWLVSVTIPEPLVTVQVFVRDGCHLCDDLLAGLAAFRAAKTGVMDFTVAVHDIEDREEWLEFYTDHVPVVVVNGEEVCHYFLDLEELEKALKCL